MLCVHSAGLTARPSIPSGNERNTLRRIDLFTFTLETARDGRSLLSRLFGLKSSKKANYAPENGVFKGFLFTTKSIERSPEISDKLLIQSALLIALRREEPPKSGYDRGEGVGFWVFGTDRDGHRMAFRAGAAWVSSFLLPTLLCIGDGLFSAKRGRGDEPLSTALRAMKMTVFKFNHQQPSADLYVDTA